MKSLTTFLLTVFIFTIATGQVPEKTSGSYFSAHFGAGPLANDGGVLAGLNLAAGYQWSNWSGVGGSLGTHIGLDYFSSGFSGLALQYRFKPFRRTVVSLDYGYIFRNRQGTDTACDIKYVPDWYPFFKTHFGWKAGSAFTLGFAFVGLPETKHEIWFFDDITNECNFSHVRSYEWPASGFMLTLGLNFN